MWIMTTNGFLSAVQHNDDANLLVIRGRVKDDVRAIAQYATLALHLPTDPDQLITAYKGSDYPFRVITTKDIWADYLCGMALSIDYGNFKSEVATTSKAHAAAYSQVWTDLLALERTDPESTRGHSPFDYGQNGSTTDLEDWREDQDSAWWPGMDAEGPDAGPDTDDMLDVNFMGRRVPSIHDVPLDQDPTL